MDTYDFSTGTTGAGGSGGSSSFFQDGSNMGGGYGQSDPFAIPQVPDWMQSGEGPLRHELQGVDKFYDISKYLKAMNRSAQGQFATDLQEGQNAASEELARSYQDGTYGKSNSAMIAAQTALPGQQKLLDTKTQAAQLALDAQQRNQKARAEIAQSIASARSQYSSTLANYITGIRGQNIQGQLGFGSQRIQGQGNQNQMMQILAQLLNFHNNSPSTTAWAGQQLGIPQIGAGDYIPNAAPGPFEGNVTY